MKANAHKIGAVLYILWGVLHIIGGGAIISAQQASAQLALQITAMQPEAYSGISNPALSGVLSYHGFNIVWFGVFAIVVAALYNWKNSAMGYWLNLLVLGAVECGVILFLLVPGYMAVTDGSIGLTLFVLAIAFSTLGLQRANSPQLA